MGYENCRSLVDAALGEAVILVDDDRVSDCVHVNVIEGYFRYRTWPSLPCFDPNTIGRMLDDWVCHCDVWNTSPGISNAETANTASKEVRTKFLFAEQRGKSRSLVSILEFTLFHGWGRTLCSWCLHCDNQLQSIHSRRLEENSTTRKHNQVMRVMEAKMRGFGAFGITIGDDWIVDFHTVCVLYVNSVSIGALSRGFYVE